MARGLVVLLPLVSQVILLSTMADENHPAALEEPVLTLVPAPPFAFSGRPFAVEFQITVGGELTDEAETFWSLEDPATDETVAEGSPFRLGLGHYRIVIPGSVTESLLEGNFEILLRVQLEGFPSPYFRRIPLTVLPHSDFYQSLLDALLSRSEGSARPNLRGDLSDLRDHVEILKSASARLSAAVIIAVIVTVAALVLAVASLSLTIWRHRQSPRESQR